MNDPKKIKLIALLGTAILLGVLGACDPVPDPEPDFTIHNVEIIHGSLQAVRGYCPTMDTVHLQYSALWAHEELYAVWGPVSGLGPEWWSVHSLPVYMQVDPWVNGVPVNGFYDPSAWFVVLRCGQEGTLQHELRHVILHLRQFQIGGGCWSTVGHTSNIDCTPCVGCPIAW